MIIDCHGHYTTAPSALQTFRDAQIAALDDPSPRRRPTASAHQRRRDPREPGRRAAQAAARARHRPDDLLAARVGDGAPRRHRSRPASAVDARVQRPDRARLRALSGELRRRLPAAAVARRCRPTACPSWSAASTSSGFIGCNLNPDPSGGHVDIGPPLTDRFWYPLYERMVELDVPAMVHVSSSCNPASTPPARITSTPTPPRSCSS
jgi:4-oxalmesaconate hydratase